MPTRRIRFVIPKDATGEEELRVMEAARRLGRETDIPAAGSTDQRGQDSCGHLVCQPWFDRPRDDGQPR